MGESDSPQMLYNLGDLIQPANFLHNLDQPFTRDEIDQVIKEMPGDKAPGPYGFNAKFIKKCWNIIKEDFYQLFRIFIMVQSACRQ
uniref:Uncharacterized protein n=1 Tax=Arundo donax TaxID=35708 RepID=A0A0A9GJ13_ARUDO